MRTVLSVAIAGCGDAPENGSQTNCDIAMKIDANIEPLQNELRSGILQGDMDPAVLIQQQMDDYRSIGEEIRELSHAVSGSELRDMTLALSDRYFDVGQSIEQDLATPPQPSGAILAQRGTFVE